MKTREQIQVKQLQPAPQKMTAAMERASNNAKTWIVWQSPNNHIKAKGSNK
jgi:hypothetical protein